MACNEAMSLVEDILVRRIHVASDCQQMMNNLHADIVGVCVHIICEIKKRMASFDHA